MRLLFTGRAVRAARQAHLTPVIALVDCHRAYSQAIHRWPKKRALVLTQDGRSVASKAGSSPPPAAPSYTSFEQHLVDQAQPNKVLSQDGSSGILIASRPHTLDATSNLSPSITNLLDRRLYLQPDHPICITRKLIESVFSPPVFETNIATNPVVTAADNFDALGFPADHPGRSKTDTYYVNEKHVLRTHTSAHQLHAFSRLATKNKFATVESRDDEYSGYTICADVFRRDSIDRSHFPVFHQMEGARVWKNRQARDRELSRFELWKQRKEDIKRDLQELPQIDIKVDDPNPAFHFERNPPQDRHDHEEIRLVAAHLKRSLEILVAKVLTAAREADPNTDGAQAKEPLKVRWIEAYFPFTSPSWELEVFWQGEWLELLGCGVVKQELLEKAGCGDQVAWAWGIGVERLAMLLFGIPDIRLFWSQDKRFLSQFKEGRINKYEPFSKYPECYKDVAFWISASPAAASPILEVESRGSIGAAAAAGGDARKASPDETQTAAFHENDVMEIVRDVAGSLAEDVKLVDEFIHPTNGRKSLCYRIVYRSLERTLTNEEVNKMHEEVVGRLAGELGVELRVKRDRG